MKRLTAFLSFSLWAICTLRYWFPRLFAGIVLGVVLFFAGLIASSVLFGCASTRNVDARPNSELVAKPVGLDTTGQLRKPPLIIEKLPARSGILSGIGNLFSTPEGRANRQARKDARAARPKTPFFIGKGAVNAPNNTGKILNAGNKGGPVANGDTGAVVTNTAIDKNKGSVAAGPNATATQTTTKPGFWSTAFATVLGNVWVWLLALLVLLWVVRKRLPVVGPFFA